MCTVNLRERDMVFGVPLTDFFHGLSFCKKSWWSSPSLMKKILDARKVLRPAGTHLESRLELRLPGPWGRAVPKGPLMGAVRIQRRCPGSLLGYLFSHPSASPVVWALVPGPCLPLHPLPAPSLFLPMGDPSSSSTGLRRDGGRGRVRRALPTLPTP